MPPLPPVRKFTLEELAFFWHPRVWAEIVARFGEGHGGSHADVRDAIILVDQDGGLGFLRWHPRKMAWALTDKGKDWVSDLLSKKKLAEARDWRPPAEALAAAEAEVKENAAGIAEEVAKEAAEKRAKTDPVGSVLTVARIAEAVADLEEANPPPPDGNYVVHAVVHPDKVEVLRAETPEEELARLAAEQEADED